jgi:HEAT repeat protein
VRRLAATVALALLVACPHRPSTPTVVDDPGLVDASASARTPAEVLSAARSSPSPDLRARAWAAGSAGEVVAGLADPDPWVQLAVVRAVGQDDALAAVAADPARDPYVRAAAAVGLGGDAGLAALGDTWRTGPASDRLALTWAAFQLGAPPARAALEELLARGDLPLEPAFFQALSAVPDPGLAAALAQGQERAEEELAFTVAAARLRLGDEAAAEVLRKGLAAPDEEVRLEVLDLLVEIQGPVADELVDRARRDGSEFVSMYAELLTLARAGKDAPAFARAFESPEWEVRQLAVRFAGAAAASSVRVPRSTEKLLEAALQDRSSVVRAEAATAIGHLGTRTALRASLDPLLADDSPDVAVAAAVALSGP